MHELWILLITFLQIGTFSIGGGYAIIPMMSEQVVSVHNWLSLKEFSDIITISQMTPGPIAVNTSTFVGMRIAGITGALIATLGCICTGVCISYVLYHVFRRFAASSYTKECMKGLKAASLGFITSAAILLITNAFYKEGTIQFQGICIFIIILCLSRKYKINPIWLMVLSGVTGIIIYH